jgi:hypothetical protein
MLLRPRSHEWATSARDAPHTSAEAAAAASKQQQRQRPSCDSQRECEGHSEGERTGQQARSLNKGCCPWNHTWHRGEEEEEGEQECQTRLGKWLEVMLLLHAGRLNILNLW